MLKRQNFSLKRHIDNNINTYTYIVSGVATAIIFSSWWYPSGIDWSMDGNEIIQAAGQFATAGALAFGIWQYHQSKENVRQSVLLDEGKLIIQRMGALLDPSRLKHSVDDFTVITEIIVRLVNLVDHLEMIVDEVSQAQKGVLAIYWHEFMYGAMTGFFTHVNYGTYIRYENLGLLQRIESDSVKAFPPGSNDIRMNTYLRASFVFKHPLATHLLLKATEREEIQGILQSFKDRFHDTGINDKLLLESHIRPDMRIFSPVIAALYETAVERSGKPAVSWQVD